MYVLPYHAQLVITVHYLDLNLGPLGKWTRVEKRVMATTIYLALYQKQRWKGVILNQASLLMMEASPDPCYATHHYWMKNGVHFLREIAVLSPPDLRPEGRPLEKS